MELDDQKIQVEVEVRKVKMDAFVASHSAVLLPTRLQRRSGTSDYVQINTRVSLAAP
jgi:hypothetical protein